MSFIKHLLPAWKQKLTGTSTNAVILSAIESSLKEAEQDTIEGKVVMELETSTGEWLDQYGNLFGPRRRDEESDDTYRARLIEYVQLERGTIPAIKEAIRSFLEHDAVNIDIYEPWRNIFYLNKSRLNGPDHLMGHYYTFAVIDIRITSTFPESIMDVIKEFKPAGVKVHLTYNPSSHNPNASIVELPLAGSNVKKTQSNLRVMNGMDDRLRGHLNLTKRIRDEDDESGLFTTNRSKLNSKDRLAGSLSASQSTYNYAKYSNKDVLFTADTTMDDVIGEEGDEVAADFYTRTGSTNYQYAEQEVDGAKDSYLYMTFDVGTYLDLEYSRYLRELQPDGIYTKNTYLDLIDKPTIQYKLKTQVPLKEPANLTIQVYNVKSRMWGTVKTLTSTSVISEEIVDIPKIQDSISNQGIVFTRIKFRKRDARLYQFHTHFYELGFKKGIGVRNTIKPLTLKVTGNTQEFGWVDSTHNVDPTQAVDTEYMVTEEDSIWKIKNKLLGTNFPEE